MTADAQELVAAVRHHQAGQLERAEEIYNRILRLDPHHADALHLLGLAAHQRRDHSRAVHFIRRAIAAKTGMAAYHNNLGAAYRGLGQLDEALESYRRAIEVAPDYAGAHYNLAMALDATGRRSEAIAEYREAIRLSPQFAEAHNNLGNALLAEEELDEAIQCFRAAVKLNPRSSEYHYNLSSALQRNGRLDEAILEIRVTIRLQPECAEAHNNLGTLLREADKLDAAAKCFEEAVRLKPDYAEAHFNLGAVQFGQKEHDRALESYQRGLALDAEHAPAWVTVAKIQYLRGDYDEALESIERAARLQPDEFQVGFETANQFLYTGQFQEAAKWYRRLLEIDPEHAGSWNNLGNACNALGQTAEAVKWYRRTLSLDPAFFEAHANLAELLRNQGHVRESIEHFHQAMESPKLGPRLRIQHACLLPPVYSSPDDVLFWRRRFEREVDALLAEGFRYDPAQGLAPNCFYLSYQGFDDRALLEKVDRLYQSTFDVSEVPKTALTERDGRIRIGFVSQHFKSHTIGNFTRGLIEKLSRDDFHVTVFTHIAHNDEIGTHIQKHSDQYIVTTDHVPAALRAIAEQDLDVLFYPDIGMDPFTFALAHSRLAPVQCVTWGHPVTTGMRTVDYFLSSDLIEIDDAQAHYTEELVRLKTLPTYYFRPTIVSGRRQRQDFCVPAQRNLYLCPQSLFKLHPEFDPLLAEILRRDPKGHLVLIRGQCDHWNDMLQARFRRTIADSVDRVQFLPRLSGIDFLSLMELADVMLDPLHFGGGNTNYQGLAAGLPIVTWPSQFQRGRVLQAMYRKMGVEDCVAASSEEYVELAVRLATQRDFRQHVRERLLANNGVLFEEQAAVDEISEFLHQAVAKARHRM